MTTDTPDDIFYSGEAADSYDKSLAPPFVEVTERDYNYPQKYPLGVDRLHVNTKAPVFLLRPIDAAHIADVAKNGFARIGNQAKQAFAFAPAPSYQKYNIAQQNGHAKGTGPLGNYPHEDLDEETGGGYVAELIPAPPIRNFY